MNIPDDEPYFLQQAANTRRLLAVWQGTEGPCRAGALFCHPLGEEKKCAHHAFVETARALARRGVASLRFDMSGCGDSEGEFREASFADWIDDICRAWADLQRRAGDCPLVLVGLRMGAALAARACRRLDGLTALALWQPVINGKEEFSSELRRLLIQQMMTRGKAGVRRGDIIAALERGEGEVELDGYVIPADGLYRDICAADLNQDAPTFPRATGIIQFSRPSSTIESFAGNHPRIDCRTVAVPPIWIRSDFIAGTDTGKLLAEQGVLRLLAEANQHNQ